MVEIYKLPISASQWFSVGQNYPTWLPSKFSTTLEPPLIFGKFLQSSAGSASFCCNIHKLTYYNELSIYGPLTALHYETDFCIYHICDSCLDALISVH